MCIGRGPRFFFWPLLDAHPRLPRPPRPAQWTRPATKQHASGKGAVRCAVYTRKSSEEGLEQDIQFACRRRREACEAFITRPAPRRLGMACPKIMMNGRVFLRSEGWIRARSGNGLLAGHRGRGGSILWSSTRSTRLLTRPRSTDFAKIRRRSSMAAGARSFVSGHANSFQHDEPSMGRLTLEHSVVPLRSFEPLRSSGERIRDQDLPPSEKERGCGWAGCRCSGIGCGNRKARHRPTARAENQ